MLAVNAPQYPETLTVKITTGKDEQTVKRKGIRIRKNPIKQICGVASGGGDCLLASLFAFLCFPKQSGFVVLRNTHSISRFTVGVISERLGIGIRVSSVDRRLFKSEKRTMEVVLHIYDVTNSGSEKTNNTIMQINKIFKDGIGLGGIFHSAVQV